MEFTSTGVLRKSDDYKAKLKARSDNSRNEIHDSKYHITREIRFPDVPWGGGYVGKLRGTDKSEGDFGELRKGLNLENLKNVADFEEDKG